MAKKIPMPHPGVILREEVYGKERMSALIETKEISANPVAMKAIRNNKAGKLKAYRIEDIPD
jgi:hypothetical protein